MLKREQAISNALPVETKGGGSSSVVRLAADGVGDLVDGLVSWRVWHLLGIRELRHRYARSRLGQLWLMLSTGIMIAVLGAVWSVLWRQPPHEVLPFVGTSLIIWTFLSQVLTECTTVFEAQGYLYRNQKMSFAVSIYSVLYKNALMLAHSLVIVAILVVAFDVPFNWYVLQIVPGFVLTCIGLIWVGYLIAMMCVRYRDVIQVISTWITVLFFITPVMWKPEFLPPHYQFLIDYNPLAQFLTILRDPLLGVAVSGYSWLCTTAIALGGGLVALPLIGRYRRRVIFWM